MNSCNEIFKKRLNNSASDTLNNIGGPYLSVRSETVSSSMFTGKTLIQKNEYHSFSVRKDAKDIEKIILRLCEKLGWKTAESAAKKLKLPSEKLLVIPKGPVHSANKTDLKKLLRSGLILSKCSENYYNPDSPMIFTLNRLHRNIELIKININNYYEMD